MGDCVTSLRKSSRVQPVLFAAGLVFCAGAGLAQEVGGVFYSFGIDQSLRHDSNPGLASPSANPRLTSRTQLSFGVVTQTHSERLAFNAKGVVIAGNTNRKGLSEPSVSLAYQRESAETLLSLSASLRRTEVDTLDFFLADDDLGGVVITSAIGTGTQEQISYNAKLDFGRNAPFGGTVGFTRTDLTYLGTTDPSLIDSTRDTFRLGLRFNLSDVTTLTANASTLRLNEVGLPASRTNSLSLGLQTDRVNGKIDADVTITDTNSGQRESLSLGRSYELPTGALTARIGLSTRTSGGTALIGSLGWQQTLPNGTLSLSLSQSVTGNASAQETRLTRLGVGYSHQLLPLLSGSFNMGLQDSLDTATSLRTRSTDLSVNMRYAVTADWGLNFGATHRILDKSGSPSANANVLSLSVSRSFDFRP